TSQARAFYLEAGRLDPTFQPVGLLQRAQRLFNDGENDGALDNLCALDALGASSVDSHVLSALILLKQGDPQRALRSLAQVKDEAIANKPFLTAMAQALGSTGAAAEAVPYLESVLALGEDLAVRRQLAGAYKAAGQFKQALAEFEKLLAL